MNKPDSSIVTFTKNDVEIIARETLYTGFFSLVRYRFRHRLFRTYPKRDFGLYLIDSHAGVETLISGGFGHQGLLFSYRFLRLLR